MSEDRKVRGLLHSKQVSRSIKKGQPSAKNMTDGLPEIWYIPGVGLRYVVKYEGRLFYGILSDNPEG